MRVLIGCEFSGVVRRSFRERGHDAWSCDLLAAEDGDEHHFQCDVLTILYQDWDLAIFHPPCTYLTNTGVRHLHSVPSRNGVLPKIHGKERWIEMRKAADFFNALKAAPIPRVALENPTPHHYATELIGDYQQAIQPWLFGVPETKRTCLWLKGLPPLMATIIETKRYPKCHMTPPGKNRGHERSRTPEGIARAFANQWGAL